MISPTLCHLCLWSQFLRPRSPEIPNPLESLLLLEKPLLDMQVGPFLSISSMETRALRIAACFLER